MTEIRAWRDAEPDQFAAAVLPAAEQLGVLPLAVEKDYWVCEALRAITVAHPGEVVFKGGTSLEKLRIIRRFSEDLDVLVIGKYESNRAAERALKSMVEVAAEATHGATSGGRSGGKAGTFHRSAYLSPHLTRSSQPEAIADASSILVELGQSGGPNPRSDRSVTSLLSRQLDAAGFGTSAWSDLAAFDVAVLHPGRTLVEKLLRINNFASDPSAQEGVHGWPRIGDSSTTSGPSLARRRSSTSSPTSRWSPMCSRVATRSRWPSLPICPRRREASQPARRSIPPARSQHDCVISTMQR